jgi:hypothetical protein
MIDWLDRVEIAGYRERFAAEAMAALEQGLKAPGWVCEMYLGLSGCWGEDELDACYYRAAECAKTYAQPQRNEKFLGARTAYYVLKGEL